MSDGIRTFFRQVQRCRMCYGDQSDIHVPMPDPIPERIRVLVIGEQPAPAGCEAAEGGEAAAAVEHLRSYLERARIPESDVLYVTAVLCVPVDATLRPGRPTATETRNCSDHLRALIERVQPKLVVSLGHTGLLALQLAFREWTELRQFILNYDVGSVLTRAGLTVYPLYLPSESTRRARPEGRQVRDWQRIPSLLESLEKAARTG